ncbi:MAG: methylated-DNA--[protein]-cysteine S-methyltransferase [Thermovirgaceae bacterium]
MMRFKKIEKGSALYTAEFESPMGSWRLVWCKRGLVYSTTRANDRACKDATPSPPPEWLQKAWDEFWKGMKVSLSLCSFKNPSEFALAVYRTVLDIPVGRTLTYKDVAFRVGNTKAARAVGAIMRANPWAPFVPCHRVIGSDGRMCGYGGPGGVDMKSDFLKFEKSL